MEKLRVSRSQTPRTCVSADGTFLVGIHRPAFNVELFRQGRYIDSLGELPDGTHVDNQINFPEKRVEESGADLIYEISNPFPFRGTTYINSAWADAKVGRPETIKLPEAQNCSLNQMFKRWFEDNINIRPSEKSADANGVVAREYSDSSVNNLTKEQETSRPHLRDFMNKLPYPLKIALAQSTTDHEDLLELIPLCCTILSDETGNPSGLLFKKGPNGEPAPAICDHTLFELIANNPCLPDQYKQVMVLRPGIQGKSEITGEWLESSARYNLNNRHDFMYHEGDKDKAGQRGGEGNSHIFEYLRRNSYIPWGHFAANTADDMVRYTVRDLTMADMAGMRHLYYQRTYLRLAEQLNFPPPETGKCISQRLLEQFRCKILLRLKEDNLITLPFNGSLWGWNFGFGYAQSGYRLHASHQQIHQQYAMIPREVSDISGGRTIPSYACGDLVADFIDSYKNSTGKPFFDTYIKAIRSNRRTDNRDKKDEIKENDIKNGAGDEIQDERIDAGAHEIKSAETRELPSDLIVYEDEHILLFAPKAQTSQWELQLMAVEQCGNILEADAGVRTSLDRGILMALQTLEKMGARMVTSIEFSKRFDSKERDQRLLYSFMPRLPESPGAFSEAQLRWINGHYPEDFAEACRSFLQLVPR